MNVDFFFLSGSILLFCLSFFLFKKNKVSLAVFCLIFGGFILRMSVASDPYLHDWDERYHALVAKNLMGNPLRPTLYSDPILDYDYTDWRSNHVWLHKQIFPLWTMAASMKLFGVNEFALRLPSIILSTLGIFLTFHIGRFFFNKNVGFIAAFLFAISGIVLEITGGRITTDHPDLFFLIFIELSVFFTILFVEKNRTAYNLLVGLSIGIAILCKWLPALIVLPIWLLLAVESGNFSFKRISGQFGLLLLVILLIALPWQIYIHFTFPLEAAWEANYNTRHIMETLEGHGGSVWYYLTRITINYGELIYLPLIFLFWKTYQNVLNLKLWSLAIWITVPMLFFSFVSTKMQGYVLFVAPAFFIVTGHFFDRLFRLELHSEWKYLKNFLLILLIALPIRYSFERIKFFKEDASSAAWANSLKNLNVPSNEQLVLFNYDRPIEAMFYTNMVVYPGLPEKTVMVNLQNKGYAVWVNQKENQDLEFKTVLGITLVRLEE